MPLWREILTLKLFYLPDILHLRHNNNRLIPRWVTRDARRWLLLLPSRAWTGELEHQPLRQAVCPQNYSILTHIHMIPCVISYIDQRYYSQQQSLLLLRDNFNIFKKKKIQGRKFKTFIQVIKFCSQNIILLHCFFFLALCISTESPVWPEFTTQQKRYTKSSYVVNRLFQRLNSSNAE